MAIKINGRDLSKRMYNGLEVSKVMKNGVQIRPETHDYLCFTSLTRSTWILNKSGTPADVVLQYSYDKVRWVTLPYGQLRAMEAGNSVYFRNKSLTPTEFSTETGTYYFRITGNIAVTGDVNYLLCRLSTDTLTGVGCFHHLFYNCRISTAPKLPATTLTENCYQDMFSGCTILAELPALPATTLPDGCYRNMFKYCSGIKLSETQTGDYQTPYRIPTTGTGTSDVDSVTDMFTYTGGTFTGTPSINTTYYTSNTIIS